MTASVARKALFGLALLVWLACFEVLAQAGTWLPFAVAGLGLTALGVRGRALPVEWFRPTLARGAVGLLCGALMVVLTHLAYASVVVALPGVQAATRELFVLLNVVGFSAVQRAVLIVIVAGCEELLFRGPLLWAASVRADPPHHFWQRGQRARIVGFASAYAITTAPLGNPLLVICAFVCGTIWGAMAVESRSLTVPALAHVVWDLGVLLVWPLTTAR